MSRNMYTFRNGLTHIFYGSDHTLGYFVDVVDDRYASCSVDEQGEGFIMEWSRLFGFTTNLIEAVKEDFNDLPFLEIEENLLPKVNDFLKKLVLEGVELTAAIPHIPNPEDSSL